MGMALAAVADDGDLLALDQPDVGIPIIVDAHGSTLPAFLLASNEPRPLVLLARKGRCNAFPDRADLRQTGSAGRRPGSYSAARAAGKSGAKQGFRSGPTTRTLLGGRGSQDLPPLSSGSETMQTARPSLRQYSVGGARSLA